MQQGSILRFFKKGNARRSEDSRSGQPYRRSHHSNSRGNSTGQQHRGPNRRRNMDLKKIADETKEELPNVLTQLPDLDVMDSSIFDLKDLPTLEALKCPGFTLPNGEADAGKNGTRIKVFDMDTFDAAIQIAPDYTASKHASFSQVGINSTGSSQQDQVMKDASQQSDTSATTASTNRKPKPVAVLNLAFQASRITGS